MIFAHAYVAIRDLYLDPESGLWDGGPDAPATWERSVQGTTGWVMIEHPDGLLAAYYVGPIAGPPAQGLFALFGTTATIEAWDPAAMPAREAFRRRLEPHAGKMHRNWPVWRVTDGAGTDSRRRLPVPLAAGLPSAGSPWAGDVTALHRPALEVTLLGHLLDTRFEDEPDRTP